MARQVFEDQVRELLADLIAMGQMVSNAIDRSVQALREQNVPLAHQVIEDDDLVNAAQHAIDEKCLVLIATQQPMAHDLRTILAASNIAAELERIGDYAEGTARLALKLAHEPFIKPLIDIPRMAELGRKMLHMALEAFVRQDTETAVQLGDMDTLVDDLYNQVYRELLLIMIQDPRAITQATYLIWVAHNLERIADRTTNIAERTVFVTSGEIVDLNR
jgi:phosphate transport system protein